LLSTGLIENLISAQTSVALHLVEKTPLLDWILKRIQQKSKKGDESSQNRQYAGELLAIILQGGGGERESSRIREEFGKKGGVDASLTVLSVRRPIHCIFKKKSID
jgi:hypothetical protein